MITASSSSTNRERSRSLLHMPLSITPDQHPARSNDTSCIVLSQPSGAIVGSMTIGIAHTVPSLCITLERITP